MIRHSSIPTTPGKARIVRRWRKPSFRREGELATADYTDLAKKFEGELAYSFAFSGQFGYLDYALSSASLTPQISGVATWHINADEPDLLDYNTDFRGPVQQALYGPNAFRSSDHDPVVIGLNLKRKHRRHGWY